MSGAKSGRARSVAIPIAIPVAIAVTILAAMVLPCAGIAQMQQPVFAQNPSATSSNADPTANPSTANPDEKGSGVSGGASSWTAGKGNFGVTARAPGGSSSGVSGGSWKAGGGGFGMNPQAGGIWRESGGGSMGTPDNPRTQSSAAKGLAPEALPGLGGEVPVTVTSPGGAGSRRILASRSTAGGRPASGAHFGMSNGFRTGGSSAGRRPTSPGAHRQPGSQSHAGRSHGSGADSSSSRAKTQVPSAFAPPKPPATGGTRQPGPGHDSIF